MSTTYVEFPFRKSSWSPVGEEQEGPERGTISCALDAVALRVFDDQEGHGDDFGAVLVVHGDLIGYVTPDVRFMIERLQARENRRTVLTEDEGWELND